MMNISLRKLTRDWEYAQHRYSGPKAEENFRVKKLKNQASPDSPDKCDDFGCEVAAGMECPVCQESGSLRVRGGKRQKRRDKAWVG